MTKIISSGGPGTPLERALMMPKSRGLTFPRAVPGFSAFWANQQRLLCLTLCPTMMTKSPLKEHGPELRVGDLHSWDPVHLDNILYYTHTCLAGCEVLLTICACLSLMHILWQARGGEGFSPGLPAPAKIFFWVPPGFMHEEVRQGCQLETST